MKSKIEELIDEIREEVKKSEGTFIAMYVPKEQDSLLSAGLGETVSIMSMLALVMKTQPHFREMMLRTVDGYKEMERLGLLGELKN